MTDPRDVEVHFKFPAYFYETALPELREKARQGGTSYRCFRLMNHLANEFEKQLPRVQQAESMEEADLDA